LGANRTERLHRRDAEYLDAPANMFPGDEPTRRKGSRRPWQIEAVKRCVGPDVDRDAGLVTMQNKALHS
jgi:hypothetical protein